ncbi:short-chain dehydrogenase/reductase family oxidoreductase [Nonlabens tegetincola]|uniref:Short-chain dehydrogenase/reductase family oxidoreductase n=1 Tax=Nonlabens tegetincola TaxID=323273 RepID=A0A090Q4D8_9FLAO|nr:SDR family oxidoreductase [Nonlabens tegetincola]GAK97954.1 short-chain dehydrogenase/reductase family oxidoreductase [Nonlabens tegetincola]
MDLQGKTAIITGASSGIGEATAKKLAEQGVNVVLCARRTEKLEELKDEITQSGGNALVVTADVTNKEDWNTVIENTQEHFNSIDILFNNAGLMPLSYVEKLKTDEWEKMVDVNLKGVLNGVAATLPIMQEQKSGHIINVSSSAGRKYFPGGAVYCATKAAVTMFSEGLRQEIAPEYGINVTLIEPGFVSTELQDTITDEDIKEQLGNMSDMTPLQANDIAQAVAYAAATPDHVNVNDVYIYPTQQKQ